eukprot:2840339-Amphidinium_carterae.1
MDVCIGLSFKCIGCIQQLLSCQVLVYNYFYPTAGLLTSFGLDLLAGQLCGPTVDRATLQLVGVLCASIFLPGLARARVSTETLTEVLAVANSTTLLSA